MIIERAVLDGDFGDAHTITMKDWELREILMNYFAAKGVAPTKGARFVVRGSDTSGHSVTLREYSSDFRGRRPKKGTV